MAALSAALLATPLWAQRGGHGGMAVGGGRGGGRGGYVGGGRGGAYGGGGYRGGYEGHGYSGHYPYYSGRYYRWGWGYRGGWGWGWYGYPWGWYGGVGWYGDSYSYPVQSYPAYVYAYPDNSGAYAQNSQIQQDEIDRLNNEVARLREERESGQPQNPMPRPPPKAEIRAGTVLVFRNHHTEEIQDYAIVGKTLWVFTEQRARKIPIADLDVPETTKANDARGIDFACPTQ